ncbi:MAG: hypothetical protein RH945_04055 [Hyphomonas sp.]
MLPPAEGYNITDGNGRAGLGGAARLAAPREPRALALHVIGREAAVAKKACAPEPDIQSDCLGFVHWKGV